MGRAGTTLSRHIIEEEHKHHPTTGELSRLLLQLGYAGKILSREICRAALIGKLGLVGETNATGDSQKKLDVYSNKVIVDVFAETKLVAGVISEEMDTFRVLSTGADAKYVLSIDPLDGSSNTDINGVIGTIFSLYRRRAATKVAKGSKKPEGDLVKEVFEGGYEHIAAGYIMYGTSTMMVYTAGAGVNGFTLDREVGEFLLSHHDIKCPTRGHTYAANIGHYYEWLPGVRKYVDYVEEIDPKTNHPYSLRYTGSLVADLHRSLIEGGIYFYPADQKHPNGKLRLMYECRPLAMVVEAAGGRASTGSKRILEVQPEAVHQQSAFVIGSTEDVADFERFQAAGGAGVSKSASTRKSKGRA